MANVQNKTGDQELRRFQNLLEEIFQFKVSDLDFGIYRILNYKRDKIKKFIEEDLEKKVESAFGKFKDEIDWIKNQVFNDLYEFFSRYYEDGDFVPQYRYSIKTHKYAIPYNGEEVKLYWVNSDQYYVKTGLLFRDYTFKATDDYKVIFRIVEAKEELGSNKATKERFFVLDDEKPVEIEDKSVVIRFQYRELTDKEVKDYEVKAGDNVSKQEKINEKLCQKILEEITGSTLQTELGNEYKNEKSLLLYHLDRFTAKNTKDYFIHKDLKKFLTEQLDYFIKSEVLDIGKEEILDKHVIRAKVVREIGEAIIDFLSQIEDFQKRLWEKKKFVLQTEYVITLDKVKEYAGDKFLEEILDEILKNKEQLKEWKDLGFGEIETKEELTSKGNLKKLPIDTRHFNQEFKEKLLEKLTEKNDLDEILDGLLIKSENWQALNLLLNKYKEKVQTIYIDPPYNTGSDEFLYRDKYQHSSWLTMMENRLSLARELMRDDGVIFVSIDDNERDHLRIVTSSLFSEVEILKLKMREPSRQLTQKSLFQKSIEYCFCLSKGNPSIQLRHKKYDFSEYKYKIVEKTPPNRTFKVKDYEIDEFLPNQYEIIETHDINDFYIVKEISIRGKIKTAQFTGKFYEEYLRPIFEKEKNYDVLYKVHGLGEDGFGFRYVKNPSEKTLNAVYYQGIPLHVRKDLDNAFLEVSYYDFYDFEKDMNNESKKLRNMNIKSLLSIKPVALIEFLLSMVKYSESNFILDFFAGSGTTAHAVMKLNKEDGGKRKFILVEMADYFDTVIIPRIKKVAYSFNWKDGKPEDEDGIGVFFKYQILEQYEDTLDNLELSENEEAEKLFKDDYFLKYFLDFETRESPYLLNVEMLEKPFNYKLKVNLKEVGEPQEMTIDLPETFNYLLGLKVKKVKARNNGRKYLFVLGEKEGKDIAVVWRNYDGEWSEEDFKKDKEFIIEELKDWKPKVVYVSAQSVLTPENWEVRFIESVFEM